MKWLFVMVLLPSICVGQQVSDEDRRQAIFCAHDAEKHFAKQGFVAGDFDDGESLTSASLRPNWNKRLRKCFVLIHFGHEVYLPRTGKEQGQQGWLFEDVKMDKPIGFWQRKTESADHTVKGSTQCKFAGKECATEADFNKQLRPYLFDDGF